MVASNTVLREGYIAMYSKSGVSSGIEVPDSGFYELGVLAKGDAAFGISPKCALEVDGHRVDEFYVYRDSWDYYSITMRLEAGSHKVELKYTNNSDRLLSDAEDRNLYLAGILVSKGSR
jgi:hypothetical protein